MPRHAHAAPGRNRPLVIAGVILIAILAFTGGVLLANSGGNEAATPRPSATGHVSSSTSPHASPSVSATPGSAPALDDGRYFVFVKKLHGTPPNASMTFDLAYFLTGEAANQAAAEHGVQTPVPNDYYIVNDNPRLRTLPLSPTVDTQAIDWTNCCELTSVPYTDWAAAVRDSTDALHGAESGYWITVQQGRIAMLEEQYTP